MTESELDALIGLNVQRWRKAAGLSQAGLAELVGNGWRQQTVAKVEQGARPLKHAEAIAVARALDLEVGDLSQSEEAASQAAQLQGFATTVESRYSSAVGAAARFEMARRQLSEMASATEGASPDAVAARVRYLSHPDRLRGLAEDALKSVEQIRSMKESARRADQQNDAVEPIEQQIEAIWKDLRGDVPAEVFERIRRELSDVLRGLPEALKRAEAGRDARKRAEQQGVKDAK